MEEVWKDISLSSLHSKSNHEFSVTTPANLHRTPASLLHDFLSSKDSAGAAPATAPATVLSLNSGQELHFLRPSFNPQCQQVVNGSFYSSFDQVMDSSSSGKKRVQDSDSSNNPVDRRQKRMIKNRESAARSRARKQAYTNELELEVAHLMEENARLRRQQEQLRVAATAQVPRKYRLHRTSTAPF